LNFLKPVDKTSLIQNFANNHQEAIDYFNSLLPAEFLHRRQGKWTAGQQLSHLYLCLVPLDKVLSSKDFIREKFGTLKHAGRTYDKVIADYKNALLLGGKAPDRFVPAEVTAADKDKLLDELRKIVESIANKLLHFSDEEFDNLVLPHPLLGSMSIWEMFCLMTYHVTHHLDQTKNNLLAPGILNPES
jgi:hypothetical protein